jgi:hypothetical protein
MTLLDATASTFAWGFARVYPAADLLRVVKHEPDRGATPSQLRVHIDSALRIFPLEELAVCALVPAPG